MSDIISSEEREGQAKWPGNGRRIHICNGVGKNKVGLFGMMVVL